ncbi:MULTISPECIES: TIGR01777 family oxidoreductase [unclassified Solwaraspora]|uniref:TIGR01777 family oxidoreductase n=1 Tax=unclassified Solwaraspora TaxID=2627926 RepID=UPI00248B2FA3|nr:MULTISPECIES: TIGR01777 family oxidoreductase [unclassified Solwaraspora]WBB95166.1 TIGR01777 family oxidoreductase [Solwaraspora sp. WMMA2059]WBC20928.1 TIGR01777 family oxidoreductase [Solwaraspora sp. WMMA2080]WBC20950.1 TIGR01777 family oxidoreductase [Solwaraspora sp. WMMA2080]WJK36960.1 TIGR01777 family oxidoreductase [Solwaraspora sp. WMMA2065]
MRILLAGASGFLGTRLTDHLHSCGHETVQLVRRPARGPAEFSWSPSAGQLDPAVFTGIDAVINLAGAGVGDKRWTDGYKALIRSSRVDSTTTLATAMSGLAAADRPAVLLNSSAVGWYGDTGDQPVEENAPAGEGFLADVARVWEASTGPAENAGVRVVRLRTGLPLHRDGGLLKPQLLPFRLGLGGKLGSGRQWVPWIAMQDWLRAVTFLLDHDDISGPVNVVGPAPVTNAAFGKALGSAVHRPAVLPVPAFALHVALGEFATEALRSSRVLPGALTEAGFTYRYPDLPDALHAALTQG